MPKPTSYFTFGSEPVSELADGSRRFSMKVTANVDEIARAAIESVRGKSEAVAVGAPPKPIAAYRCLVCNETMHTTSGYVPLFCQRCGRLLDYGEGDD